MLKVFILAGQSNMEGRGTIYDSNTTGTLEHFLENDLDGDFDYLTNGAGSFISRDDVWVRYDREWGNLKTGNLGIGYGSEDDYIGPEYGFGFHVGDYFDDQVLIIKTAWGGKSLAVDFRPPSSGGTVGPYYNQILTDIEEALNNLSTEFPNYDGSPYEIVGFGWHQGWNDGETQAYMDEYESNMINFIKDMRTDLDAPNMQFVIANTGIGGFELSSDGWTYDLQTNVVPAQGNAAVHPDFNGTVSLADTRPFWRTENESPADELHHWHKNGETYFLIGNEMGLKMVELLNNNTVGNQELKVKTSFYLYPNPATDVLTIVFENIPAIPEITFRNSLGQKIHHQSIKSNLVQVDVSQWSNGIYFLQLNDGENHKLVIVLDK